MKLYEEINLYYNTIKNKMSIYLTNNFLEIFIAYHLINRIILFTALPSKCKLDGSFSLSYQIV